MLTVHTTNIRPTDPRGTHPHVGYDLRLAFTFTGYVSCLPMEVVLQNSSSSALPLLSATQAPHILLATAKAPFVITATSNYRTGF